MKRRSMVPTKPPRPPATIRTLKVPFPNGPLNGVQIAFAAGSILCLVGVFAAANRE